MSDATDGEPTEDEDAEEETPAPEPAMAWGALVSEFRNQTVLHTTPDAYIGVMEAMRNDGFASIIDLCVVDYLTHPGRNDLPPGVEPQRFELVVTLINHTAAQRVRVRVQVSADDPTVPTLFDHFPGSEAMEREANDLFGIVFENHPDPTRILLPSDWNGYPLRKDYAVGAVPVQFKGAPGPR